MPKRRTTRLYWKRGRAYGDFRDLGGRKEALKAPNEKLATTDPDVANKLVADRVARLTEKRRNLGLGIKEERKPAPTLGLYASRHLVLKKKDKECSNTWLAESERHLKLACQYFGEGRALDSIDPEALTAWVNHLRKQPSRRGGKLTDSTIRKMLNTLSNLYARAVSEQKATGVVSNPVAAMFSKPTPQPTEAAYLAPAEAAILLEAARTYRADAEQGAFPSMYALLSTFLLTGGRRAEVLGLEVDDVSLKLGKIYIRPNSHRRLKTSGSTRTIPLWPQLAEILKDYFTEREQAGSLGTGLLFPAVREEGTEKMLVDLRKPLARIAARAGFPPDAPVRLHQLRHTYTAARMQTCDRGRPVAPYTVARELGHSSTAMIERVYGHLHDRAQGGGSEVVEFKVKHYHEKLGDRLEALVWDGT